MTRNNLMLSSIVVLTDINPLKCKNWELLETVLSHLKGPLSHVHMAYFPTGVYPFFNPFRIKCI